MWRPWGSERILRNNQGKRRRVEKVGNRLKYPNVVQLASSLGLELAENGEKGEVEKDNWQDLSQRRG
jgi:hypothetical protein